jgi:hypothetical protein
MWIVRVDTAAQAAKKGSQGQFRGLDVGSLGVFFKCSVCYIQRNLPGLSSSRYLSVKRSSSAEEWKMMSSWIINPYPKQQGGSY